MALDSELMVRAAAYCQLKNLSIDFSEVLGHGNDGSVWNTSAKTAVKCFIHERVYRCELGCYQRLSELEVTRIDEFAIPQFIDHNDELLVIEIKVVSRPCILDFGKVYLDSAPQHTPEVLREWEEIQAEIWGKRWPRVKKILLQLKLMGIHYTDPNPGNIMFATDDDDE